MTRPGPAYWIGALLWSVLLHAAVLAWYLWPDDLPQREGAPTGRGIVIGLSPSDASPAERSGSAQATAASQPSPPAPRAPPVDRPKPEPPTPQIRPQEARRAPDAPPAPTVARPGDTAPRASTGPADASQEAEALPLPSVKPTPPPRPAAPARASQPSQAGAPTAIRSGDSLESRQAEGSIDSYLGTIRRWLERHKRYPDAARANGEEGIVKVRFRLRSTGHVRALGVVVTSGSWILDQEALATIRRSAPFPAFPASVTDDELAVVVDVKFSLN